MLNWIKNIGLPELIIIAIIIIIFFGARKSKELSHGLGESVKEAKKVKKELQETAKEVRDSSEENPPSEAS